MQKTAIFCNLFFLYTDTKDFMTSDVDWGVVDNKVN